MMITNFFKQRKIFLLTLLFMIFSYSSFSQIPKNQPDSSHLRDSILKLISKYPNAKFAIAFKDLRNGRTFFMNEKELFHAASTMKTAVMAEVFKQIDEGKFNLNDSVIIYNRFKSIVDDSYFVLNPLNDSEQNLYRLVGKKTTIYDLMQRMITRSSNLATDIIVDKVGAKNIMKTLKKIGAKDMIVLRGVEDSLAYLKGLNNKVTAHDLMLIFEKMGNGSLINRTADAAMIKILDEQYFNSMIPAKLPAGVRVAHKTGSIENICHDAGLVMLPDGSKYVIVLLSAGLNEDEAKPVLADISKFIYDYDTSK